MWWYINHDESIVTIVTTLSHDMDTSSMLRTITHTTLALTPTPIPINTTTTTTILDIDIIITNC